MIVTMRRLISLGACLDGRRKFARRFGAKARVKVTREGLLAFRGHANWIADNLFPEHLEAYHDKAPILPRLSYNMRKDDDEKDCANALADVLGLE